MTEETFDDQEVPEQKSRERKSTETSSVSISKEFRRIIKKHKLSPSEVFRRGVAVTLFDIGEEGYINELNSKRSEFSKKFLDEIKIYNLCSILDQIHRKTTELRLLSKQLEDLQEEDIVR